MLKSIAIGVGALALSAGSASALDAYGRAYVGVGDADVGPFQTSGDLVGGALGLDDLGPFRVEAAATHFDTSVFGVSAAAWDFAGTAYIDIPLGSRFTISPNVGVDWATVDLGFGSADATGWHWGVEASTPLTDTLDLTGAFTRTDLDFDGLNVTVDAMTLGLRFDL